MMTIPQSRAPSVIAVFYLLAALSVCTCLEASRGMLPADAIANSPGEDLLTTRRLLGASGDGDDTAQPCPRDDDPQFWTTVATAISVAAMPVLLFVALALADVVLNGTGWGAVQTTQASEATKQLPSVKSETTDEESSAAKRHLLSMECVSADAEGTPCVVTSAAQWQSDWTTRQQLYRLLLDGMGWTSYLLLAMVTWIYIHHDKLQHVGGAAAMCGVVIAVLQVLQHKDKHISDTLQSGDGYLWQLDSRKSPASAGAWMQQLIEAPCEMKWRYIEQKGTEEELQLSGVKDATSLTFPVEAMPAYSRIQAIVEALPANQQSADAWNAVREQLVERHGLRQYRIVSSVTINGKATHCSFICPTSSSGFSLRALLLHPWVYRLALIMSFDVLYHCWLAAASPVLKVTLVKVYNAEVEAQTPAQTLQG